MSTARPSTALAAVRVAVITVVATLLSFVVSLFLSVITLLVLNLRHGGGLDMTLAYRRIALPVALVAMVIAFAIALTSERRYLRRTRAGTSSFHRAA